jgi:hypothetical protein
MLDHWRVDRHDPEHRTRFVLEGRVSEGRGRLLTHAEITPTNTLDQPDNVTLRDLSAEVHGDAARVSIPKHAVVALELRVT